MYVHNVVGTGSYTTSTTNMYHKDRFHVPLGPHRHPVQNACQRFVLLLVLVGQPGKHSGVDAFQQITFNHLAQLHFRLSTIHVGTPGRRIHKTGRIHQRAHGMVQFWGKKYLWNKKYLEIIQSI